MEYALTNKLVTAYEKKIFLWQEVSWKCVHDFGKKMYII